VYSKRIIAGFFVYDGDVLDDEGGERLEVNLLKSDVSVKLVGHFVDNLAGDGGLDFWKLYRQRSCKQDSSRSDQCQPKYFESLFYNSYVFDIQLAKVVKISDKIRIFAAGLECILHASYALN
jgi:hypothetical protein